MKTRKNPYGFPILGTIAAVAAVAGWAKNASDNKDAKNREKEAKAEADKEKEKQKLIERQEKTTQSQIDAVNSEIQIRQGLFEAQRDSEREKTQAVDDYRSQVGLVGADFDAVLNSLYAEERRLVEDTAKEQLAEEQAEIDALQPPPDNTAKIALFSLLGVATIGGAIYYNKQRS